MKSKKLAGIRLFNYLNDGINWKDHKDIILDYWIKNIAPQYNRSPDKLQGFVTVESLPTAVQKEYEDWFKKFDFQTSKDQKWIEFVNGTLNIFYHTNGYRQEPKDVWYIDLMKSEVKARNIVESQVYHGNPNLNSFMKIETNSKPEEVGGGRNGENRTQRSSDVNGQAETVDQSECNNCGPNKKIDFQISAKVIF